MVRDYALATSGLLSSKMYGPGVKPYQPEGIWDIVGLPGGDTRNYVQGQGEDLYRRTLYTFWKRMAPPPNLGSVQRAQSRGLYGSPRTNQHAAAGTGHVERSTICRSRTSARGSGSDAVPAEMTPQTLDSIAQRVLGRPINEHEQTIVLGRQARVSRLLPVEPRRREALISVGESKDDESLEPSQLAAWTMVCNQVMNLDEALNK